MAVPPGPAVAFAGSSASDTPNVVGSPGFPVPAAPGPERTSDEEARPITPLSVAVTTNPIVAGDASGGLFTDSGTGTLPFAGTIAAGASVVQPGVTPAVDSAYVTAFAVGFFSVTV